MQATCGSDYRRVGSLMNLDPDLIAGKVEANQRVQFIYQIRRIRHREPFLNRNGKTNSNFEPFGYF